MRIAILVEHFPPKGQGGTEIATYFMAVHLARRGHDVHVIYVLDEGMPYESREKGFSIHRIPLVRIRILGAFFFWYAVFRAIRKIDPDIVHVQSLVSGMPALFAKKLLRIPYVVWGQGSDVYLPKGFIKWTSRMVMKNAGSAIALTQDMKRAMQDICDRDVAIVPNGISLAEVPDGPGVRDEADQEKRVLYVGRLSPVKGIQYLIRAMKQVHDAIPEARLIIIGDGREREMLKALAGELGIEHSVEFSGEVPHGQVLSLMQQADVFVLPSLSEGFPMVIVEALACGLPVVASRVGGLPEIITDGTNGFLVEAKDVMALAEKIRLLLQDEQLRKKISADNRELVRKYTWENVVMELEKLYAASGA
jgi:glycosyltransferase involved in cell wall biosynthesis